MGCYDDDIRMAASEALPWERLEGKNILITGATGLIGGCLVEVLNPSSLSSIASRHFIPVMA